MRQFKKKTLALILASTITVVGSFGAENYKNSLMSLEFSNESSGSVNVKLFTKLNYENNITLQKKDATTYVIMLPETDGQSAQKPELAPNIESVDIKTMPYTTNNKGYTKITLKTTTNIPLTASKALYIPSTDTDTSKEKIKTSTETTNQNSIKNDNDKIATNAIKNDTVKQPNKNETAKNAKSYDSKNIPNKTDSKKPVVKNELPKQVSEDTTNVEELPSDNSEVTYLIIGALLVIFVSIFLFLKGKDKMAQIIGEQGDFSIDDDEENTKKNIKSTINKLDKTYKKPIRMPINTENKAMPIINKVSNNTPDENKSKIEESVIVDLDELYNSKSNEYNNEALDEFLSDFNFEDENKPTETEVLNIDDSLFEKYIKNGAFKFSKEDVDKINELINIEINDDTLKNISDYAVSNPIENIKPEGLTNLENIVTSYVINQNISFTREDVEALEKLINVEIDSEFVSDLTTNPERTAKLQQEIEARQIAHKSHEMLTLNVKDVLPDLSEALKKQNGKKIESEVKPQVVYFSEGYDVNTLHVKDELPAITIDLDNPEYKKYRPSDDFEMQDNRYELSEISVKDDLPDLNDAIANPEKYEDKKVKVEVNEEEMLKNISNVAFKPIYTEEDSLDIEEFSNIQTSPILSNQEKEKNNKENDNQQNLEYDNNSDTVLSKQCNTKSNEESCNNERTNQKTKELMKIIDSQKKERNLKRVTDVNNHSKIPMSQQISKEKDPKSSIKECIVDGEKYNIISMSKLTNQMGCYLAKNDREYAILGFVGESIFKIKYYKTLNSDKIQTRLNEKLDENTAQYLVRIGIHKFIVNVTKDNMEYVMDLC